MFVHLGKCHFFSGKILPHWINSKWSCWSGYGGWIRIVLFPNPCPLLDGIIFISCETDCPLDLKAVPYTEWTGVVAVMGAVFITSVFVWHTQNKKWHSFRLYSLSWDSVRGSTGIPLISKEEDMPLKNGAMTKHFLKQNFPLWGRMLLSLMRITWCRWHEEKYHAQVE